MNAHIWCEVTPLGQDGSDPQDHMMWFICNRCESGFPAEIDMTSPDKPDPYVAFQEHLKVSMVLFEDCDLCMVSRVLHD